MVRLFDLLQWSRNVGMRRGGDLWGGSPAQDRILGWLANQPVDIDAIRRDQKTGKNHDSVGHGVDLLTWGVECGRSKGDLLASEPRVSDRLARILSDENSSSSSNRLFGAEDIKPGRTQMGHAADNHLFGHVSTDYEHLARIRGYAVEFDRLLDRPADLLAEHAETKLSASIRAPFWEAKSVFRQDPFADSASSSRVDEMLKHADIRDNSSDLPDAVPIVKTSDLSAVEPQSSRFSSVRDVARVDAGGQQRSTPLQVVVVNGRDLADGVSKHLADRLDAPLGGVSGPDSRLSPWSMLT